MGSLSNLYISQSYKSLAHLGTNDALVAGQMTELQDGLGNSLNINFDGTNISSSGNIYAANITASVIDTSTFVTTASFNQYTSSNDSKVNQLINATGSYANSASVATVDYNQQLQINQLIAVTASFQTSSTDISSLNQFTASQNAKNATLATYTASVDSSLLNINQFTASNGNTSLNQYTQSNDAKWTNIGNQSGSWITESETGSFARYDVSNPWSANQNFTNITAISASFTYVQTTYETSSVIYSSGSNQFGDAADDIQTLYGSVRVVNELTASGLNYPTADNGEKSFIQTDGNGNLSLQYVDTIWENVKAGENVIKGTPLYISGSQGANPIVYAADASNPAKMPVTFIAGDAYTAETTYPAIVLGLIEGLDLTGYTAGQTVYVAEGGGWSTSLPSGSNSITQVLGVVTKGGNGGKGLVLNPGPAQLPGLQTGYAWVGNGSNRPVAVATSSFGTPIDTGSFVTTSSFNSYTSSTDNRLDNLESTSASVNISISNLNAYTQSNDTKWNTLGGLTGSYATTGSNTFTGDQTLIDAAGNFVTLSDASGSLMLVAKSFTSASAHMSASAAGVANLIFKTNNNTADTIISGSSNLFVNPAAPTAGFKRYFGGSGNIALNASNVSQISSSMAFSPTMNNNYFGGNSVALTMRGPVSASAWTISANNILGTLNIGQTAVLHASQLTNTLTMTGNISAGGTTNIIANQSALTGSTTSITNNYFGGSTSLILSSSAVAMASNIITDSGFTLTNQYYSSSLGLGVINFNRNIFSGQSNQLIVSGAQAAGAGAGNSFSDNFVMGGSNTLYGDITNARVVGGNPYHQIIRTGLLGNNLIVTGSSLLGDPSTLGTVIVGRYNATNGNTAKTAETVFAVGTGNATTRKTGFLIDSGSNTFIEGSLTVSGSTTISGSTVFTGSISMVDRSGYTDNVYLGLDALGVGGAGSQPLAVSNTSAIAIGNGAMRYASGSSFNLAIGAQSLSITTGSNNIAIGFLSMQNNTTGRGNVAIGTDALKANTTGEFNFALGNGSLVLNTTGGENVAIGATALNSSISGQRNIAIGSSAGARASGSNNTMIGYLSGADISGSNNVVLGSYNTFTAGEVIDNNIFLADGSGILKAQYDGDWQFKDTLNVTGSFSATGDVKLSKGSNKTCDIVSVNGSLTVANSLVTTNSIILVTTQNGVVGVDEYPAVVTNKGTGTFDIQHNYAGNLDVAYLIINPV